MGNRWIIVSLVLFLLICPTLVIAEVSLPPSKVGECVRVVQSHPNATSINITNIRYPNSSSNPQIVTMSSSNNINYYSDFCDTNQTGKYIVTTCGDGDGDFTCMDYGFTITGNGQEPPTGAVIVIFVILVLFVLLVATYLIIYSFGHSLSLDFDIIDLAWNYGVFFVLVGMKIFQEAYLGNVVVDNFLTWAINIGIFVIMVLPTIYFILTITIGSILKKRVRGVDFGN